MENTGTEHIHWIKAKTQAVKHIMKLSAFLIRKDPSSMRFIFNWLNSFRMGHNPLSDQQPALTFKSIEFLESYLKPHMKVFEYGTGGSTFYFSKRVSEVVSVEHNQDWFSKMSELVGASHLQNCQLILREPQRVSNKTASSQVLSTLEAYRGFEFSDYVRSIDDFPDSYFDLVVIDGRARTACLKAARSKIKAGGYLLLDNAERPHYAVAQNELSNSAERTDYWGVGPYSQSVWCTSTWRC